ncbi:uncharacterized protein N7515_003390 [Penicillium bovifimosum]|uniref:AAA+ ATPase domain-containing protein n=1 Tax=Penicillium bovifimosum TaxID=126998 RepID=A0A9W9H4K3_9EURO|nr:uncharacterized protein N7515_003390 [Penicillium bovifimosum]KAJ5138542.1 hypothetical protein N7515_003390 [Penicillium bovifimosum]
MMRPRPASSLQKTYDECYLACSTAVYFEGQVSALVPEHPFPKDSLYQNNEEEALRSWRSALDVIYHHNARRVPSNYHPKSETEKALQDSIRALEVQCRERVDLLGALQASRKESGDASSSKASATLVKGKFHPSIPRQSSSNSPGWIGDGTIPAVDYTDLSKPAAIPGRPALPGRHSTESPASFEDASPAAISAAGAPALRVHSNSSSKSKSRGSSQERRKPMLTTLRSKDGKKSSKKVKATSKKEKAKQPAASRAAGLAWGSIYRGASGEKPVSETALASSRQSAAAHDPSFRREPEPRSSLGEAPSPARTRTSRDLPGDRIPAAHWREPLRPSPKRSSTQTLPTQAPTPPRAPRPPADSPKLPPPSPALSMPNPADFAPQPKPSIKPKPVALRSSYQPPSANHPIQSPRSEGTSRTLTPRRDVEQNSPIEKPRIRSAPRIPKIDGDARNSPLAGSSTSGDDLHRGVNRLAISQRNGDSVPRRKPTPITRRETPPSSEQETSDHRTIDSDAEDEDEENSDVAKIMEKLPKGIDPQSAKQILNDIVVRGDEVHWDDIAGLEGAKKALKEAVVYPFLRPDLFSGLREPARGMLLFGPPGTGKTMLARAVATESKSTFFSISASSLTSKWHGESEKLVRALFGLAKALAPSIIFVDEIDSLLSARSSGSEHEASRRSKTEFLVQWSDLQRAAAGREQTSREKKEGDASRVLVLAATNLPWDIDEAARRRFVRRQYIPLPEQHVREQQLRKLISHQHHELSDADIQVLVQVTEGFSGSDITALAKDAAMGPLRNLGEALLHTPMDQIRAIIFQDFEASLYSIRPSVSPDGLRKYEEWAKEFGERGG